MKVISLHQGEINGMGDIRFDRYVHKIFEKKNEKK